MVGADEKRGGPNVDRPPGILRDAAVGAGEKAEARAGERRGNHRVRPEDEARARTFSAEASGRAGGHRAIDRDEPGTGVAADVEAREIRQAVEGGLRDAKRSGTGADADRGRRQRPGERHAATAERTRRTLQADRIGVDCNFAVSGGEGRAVVLDEASPA